MLLRSIKICLLVLCLAELISGIGLLLHYRANTFEAFLSVQSILNSENLRWFCYDLHKVGANLLILFSFLYLFICLWQQRYRYWLVKIIFVVLLLLGSYSGNILPWSQLSTWLLTALPSLNLKVSFLVHVIFIPIVLIILISPFAKGGLRGIFLARVNPPKSPLPPFAKGGIPLRKGGNCFLFLIYLLIFLFFTLVSPNVFSIKLENFSALMPLPVLYDYPPWYLAPWFALYKSFGYTVFGLAVLVWFLVPLLLKPTKVSFEHQFHPLVVSLLLLCLIGLGATGMHLHSTRSLLLAQCLTVIYFILWIGLIVYSRWRQDESEK